MPGLALSRSNAPFLNKIKASLSRTKASTTIADSMAPAQVELCTQTLEQPCQVQVIAKSTANDIPTEFTPTIIPNSLTPPPLSINDLPPEILSEIFHTYMFWDYDPDLMDPELEGMVSVFSPNPRSAPLLFCRVCSLWRSVAISTPALWSAIAVVGPFNPDTVALWLQRSQSHPISLIVSLHHDMALSDTFARLLGMLHASMPRWKHITLHLPTAKDMRRLLFTLIPEKGKSPATRLQYLHLSANYREEDHVDAESLARLSSFPHPTLRRLTWDDYIIPDFSRVSPSLWSNLEHISFWSTNTSVLLSFLKACENVRFINIHCLETKIDANLPTEHLPIISRNLQALNIAYVVGDLRESLDLLVTPELKRLSFEHRGGGGQSIGLRNFLERSGCKLECLCIINKSSAFDEKETKIMLRSPIFTAIPHFSLRLTHDACQPSFPEAIIAETAGQWKDIARACYEPKNYAYHLGWGTLDITRSHYIEYPFLIKEVEPTPKWTVALTDGPLVSA
ncbi:hypothetical protein CVT24_002309 [Panaeolus cyanescens]|uniref:Uncharacterized protein n=1 Tax=Panaeolus cyanescens TaxID=181874 RepID=A0A409YIU5_9AGAR|nr:hypothetical protein CVT24_002309 [Panaeolus cyanescens]